MRPICEAVKAVEIDVWRLGIRVIKVDGVPIDDIDAFARADGFSDHDDMWRFWFEAHGTGVFQGVMICWGGTPKEEP